MSTYGDLTHALTIWEPWASAIVHGPKPIENRTWHPPRDLIDNRIWIHAGKVFDEAVPDMIEDLWPAVRTHKYTAGAIIGCARIVGTATEGTVEKRVGLAGTDWFSGPVGWVLADRVALREPVLVSAAQGLWVPPADVLARAMAGLVCASS